MSDPKPAEPLCQFCNMPDDGQPCPERTSRMGSQKHVFALWPAEPQAVPEIPADLRDTHQTILEVLQIQGVDEPWMVMCKRYIERIALLESQLRDAERKGWNEAIRAVKDVLHDEGWIGEAYRRINHLGKPAQEEQP